MPTNTYVALATQTLGSAAASVTFSSIPATYTDLVLIASVQASTSAQGLTMQVNGDTSSLYSNTGLRGNGSVVASFRQSNNNNFLLSNLAEPPTSGSFGLYIANFQNYSNTTTYKTVTGRTGHSNYDTEASVGLWRSTAAINTIQVYGFTNILGSTFSLYGILKA